MCAYFLVHKYLILFLHLLADGEISKDLEEIDAKKQREPESLDDCIECTYGPAWDIQKNMK